MVTILDTKTLPTLADNSYDPRFVNKTIEWLDASDDYTRAMLAKFENSNEKTSIKFRLAREKFEIVERDLKSLIGNTDLKSLTIAAWKKKSGKKPTSTKKK